MTAAEAKKIRQQLGLTQLEMGRAVGVTDRYIRAIESGKRNAAGPLVRLYAALRDGHVRPEITVAKADE